MPQYEGPNTNPHSGSHQSVPKGVILVESSPVNRPTTVEPSINLDFHTKPSAATALPQIQVAQVHAVHCMTSPPSASWESPQVGAAFRRVEVPALNVLPSATPLFADMPDSPDYEAALAQALANLCRRVSEENRVQPAHQAVPVCKQNNEQNTVDSSLSRPAAGVTDLNFLANSSEFQNNSSQVGAGSSKSAGNAAETFSDDLTAMVGSLLSSEVQHAAVDQVLDNLLTEVAAPLQPVQSIMPADTSGVKPMVSPRVSPRVSLPAKLFAPQHAAVDQVLDDLLTEVSAPLRPVQSSMPAGSCEATLMVSLPADKGSAKQMLASMPPIPAPDTLSMRASNRSPPLLAQLSCLSSKPLAVAKELAGTPGQPVGTASEPVLAEAQLSVPSGSSSNKENDPMLETVPPSKVRKQTADKGGDGSMVISRGCCLDRRTFEEMAQALPTEPSSQVMQLVPAHNHMQ